VGADAATANIPVIVLRSLTEKSQQKPIAAGAEDYVEEDYVEKEFPDADARGECVAENTRESDLPHQAQTRSRFQRRPTSRPVKNARRLMRRVPRKERAVKKILL
jgi:hypothetical protein